MLRNTLNFDSLFYKDIYFRKESDTTLGTPPQITKEKASFYGIENSDINSSI